MDLKLICQFCNKEYSVKPYRKNKSKYCSILCSHKTPRRHSEKSKQRLREYKLGKPRGTKNGNNINCKTCGKEFYVMPYLEKIKKTCSKDCFKKWKSKTMKGKMPKNINSIKGWNKTPDIKCNCLTCSNKFILTKAQLKSKNYTGKFCSRKCYWLSMDGKKQNQLKKSYKFRSEKTREKMSISTKKLWNKNRSH